MISQMKPGSVVVDIAIDQGGCIETSKPTTHDDPVFLHNGCYSLLCNKYARCCALTATLALNKATMPFIEMLTNEGINKALESDPHLANGSKHEKWRDYSPSDKDALGL